MYIAARVDHHDAFRDQESRERNICRYGDVPGRGVLRNVQIRDVRSAIDAHR